MADLICVKMAARRLSVTPKRVYRLIQDGKLDCLRAGPRCMRVTTASLERFIEEGVKKEKRELGLDLEIPKIRRRI